MAFMLFNTRELAMVRQKWPGKFARLNTFSFTRNSYVRVNCSPRSEYFLTRLSLLILRPVFFYFPALNCTRTFFLAFSQISNVYLSHFPSSKSPTLVHPTENRPLNGPVLHFLQWCTETFHFSRVNSSHYKFLPRFLIEILMANYTTVIARRTAAVQRDDATTQWDKTCVRNASVLSHPNFDMLTE